MNHAPRPEARGPGAALWLLTARRRLMLAAALGLPWLTGCVVAPHSRQPVVYGQPVYGQPAPPPPQYEVVGMAPAAGHVWVSGHWAWQVSRYVWVGGHWAPTRLGHHWARDGWHHRDRGGWMRNGRWERR